MPTQIAAVVLGQLALLGLVIWVVAVRLQERARWRVELQMRLLDRFASPGELQQFLESEGGRRLLGTLAPRQTTAPRLLLAVQAGIVLTILGSGLQITGNRDLQDPGIAFVAVGLGLVAAALVSWVLARMWGLLPDARTRADQ
jgi:ABC-type Fe3+-siderophore transport system permease subunit